MRHIRLRQAIGGVKILAVAVIADLFLADFQIPAQFRHPAPLKGRFLPIKLGQKCPVTGKFMSFCNFYAKIDREVLTFMKIHAKLSLVSLVSQGGVTPIIIPSPPTNLL